MPRRKKKQYDYDSYDDYEDEQSAMEAAQPEVAKVSLDDFVIKEKVSAFVRDYEPCDEFDAGAERFGDGELRTYFKAYVTGLGDPLQLYIEDLKFANFKMVTSLATQKPCIFARRKFN
jgi:hypothetical protein